jgi:tetratricopeptide (TPR) repeat protein
MPRWVVLGADAVLNEIGTSLGLALWQRLQDTDLWAQTAPQERRDLFHEQDREDALPPFTLDPGPETALDGALRIFGSLVVYPDRADIDSVVSACLDVAGWASERGHELTGEYFTELATLVKPESAELARLAGRVARRRTDYDRGIRWYRRSVALARNAHDHEAKALAFIWWGTLEEQRGNAGKARELYMKGWRTATRKRLRQTAASARHDLLVLCELEGSYEEGMQHAQAALQAYAHDEPRLPALAHDIAAHWARYGFFEEALRLFETALPYIQQRHERVQVISSIARAAAATHDLDRFFAAWDEVAGYALHYGEAAAASLINIARGARTLRREAVAKELLGQALQFARRRGEPAAERVAQDVLDAVEPVDEVLPAPPEVTQMLSDLLQRMEEFAASR